jgi:hypothetical protein
MMEIHPGSVISPLKKKDPEHFKASHSLNVNFAVKKFSVLALFLLFLSAISGYLMSRPSLVGRIGISMFYKEYRFLRTWWKGALLVFIVLIVLAIIFMLVQKYLEFRTAKMIILIFIIIGIIGTWLTYSDFQNTTTHRWLKERFHLGAYTFWLGWFCVCMVFMLQKKTVLINYEKERVYPGL